LAAWLVAFVAVRAPALDPTANIAECHFADIDALISPALICASPRWHIQSAYQIHHH
jgi:hypothetical protein